MDIKEIDKLITNKHEEYERNLPLWQRNYLAWLGGDDFKLQNLWPFEREEQEDFDDRLIRASYENMFADIIQRRQGLVFSRKIERRSNDYLLKLNQNIDGLGTCREEFIKKCFRLSQIFGFLPVLVENRVTASESSPRLVPVNPFNLINWQMDEDGFCCGSW